jgi:hypothetical protein
VVEEARNEGIARFTDDTQTMGLTGGGDRS